MPGPQTATADIDFTQPPPAAIDFSQPPPAIEKPSAAERFVFNGLSGLGVTSNEQAKYFFAHPLDTVLKSFEAQGELAKKAREAYNRGDYMEALQHGLNYMVPFVGQQTDQAGTQLKEGDIAGGVGRTLGAAVPIIAGSPVVQATASDVAAAAAAKGAQAIRASARGANVALAKAPGTVGGAVGAAAGGYVGGHIGAEVGGAAGAMAGRELLPQVRIPGEGFGLPSRVTGGPVVAPKYVPGEAGSVAESVAQPAAPAPVVKVTPAAVQQQLESALGGQKLVPGVPLRSQPAAQAAAAAKMPEGFTPVESSALKGFKYDPATREFESITTGGQHYIHGDVSPEEADYFANAESKGKAWQQLRSQNPLVAKVVNGKRVAVKPTGPITDLAQQIKDLAEPSQAPSGRTLGDLGKQIKAAAKKSAKASTPANAPTSDLEDQLTQMLKQVKAGKQLSDLSAQ